MSSSSVKRESCRTWSLTDKRKTLKKLDLEIKKLKKEVISSFLYTLYTELYVAGAVIVLFVEVNSVTLHLRLLLKLAMAHSSSLYYINKFVNIVTYVTFRLSVQFYLTWYTIQNYSWLDHGLFFLICLMVLNIMMLIYFYRLIRADFFPRSQKSVGQNGVQHSNSKKFPHD